MTEQWEPVSITFEDDSEVAQRSAVDAAMAQVRESFAQLRKEGLLGSEPVMFQPHFKPVHREEGNGEEGVEANLWTLSIAFIDLDVPTFTDIPSVGRDIVRLDTGIPLPLPGIDGEAPLLVAGQPVNMYLFINAERNFTTDLVLHTEGNIDHHNPFFIRTLNLPFASVGLSYDFSANPAAKEQMQSLATVRLPSEAFSDKVGIQVLHGYETVQGLAVTQRIALQSPNPDSHLRCYEVEIFRGKQKNIPETTSFAPEAIWQDNQNHYCLAAQEDYPLFPISPDKTAKIALAINAVSPLPPSVTSLIDAVPLSLDQSNQWFTELRVEEERVAIMRHPSWPSDTVHLVNKKHLEGVPTAETITKAAQALITAKNSLPQ